MCLKSRVKKAKEARFTQLPGVKGAWGTSGSSESYKHNYQQFLSSKMETINDPDNPTGKINIPVLLVECYQDTGVGTAHNCPGNERHTICYHGLGAIYNAYKTLSNQHISFYTDYKSAINGLNFGGKLAKIESKQGDGECWAVIRDIKPKVKNLDNLAVNLMRGKEDEGID